MSSGPAFEPIAITGLGIACGLGRRVENVVAAQRCGIARPSMSTELTALDPDEGSEVTVLGHGVVGYTEGYEEIGRCARLASLALDDLTARLDSRPPAPDALLVVTPRTDPERFATAAEEWQRIPELLAPALPDSWSSHDRLLVAEGHLGLTAALAIVGEHLGRSWRSVLVVAADSYLDLATLDWLRRHARLKADGNETGVVPGEAGVCLLLEPGSAARRSGATIHALVRSVALSRWESADAPTDPEAGRGLASVLREVSAGVEPSLLRNSLAVTDLNGELGRSMRWGTALTMLEGELRHLQLVCPAESFGEIGAASGPASVCVAAESFARGYSPSSLTFVVSMDNGGASGAILLQGP